MELDRAFHQAIAAAARNAVLADILRGLHERSLRFWFVTLSEPHHLADVQHEHRELFDRLSARDAAAHARPLKVISIRSAPRFNIFAPEPPMTTFTPFPPLAQLAADLAAGRTTSRALVDTALDRIADPSARRGRLHRSRCRQRARGRRRARPAARRGHRAVAARGHPGVGQGPVRRRGSGDARGFARARRARRPRAPTRSRSRGSSAQARCWSAAPT